MAPDSVWEIVFLMVILKIPIVYLCAVIYYAIKSEPRPEEGAGSTVTTGPHDDGGGRRRRRLPRFPRPHGSPARRYPRAPEPVLAATADARRENRTAGDGAVATMRRDERDA